MLRKIVALVLIRCIAQAQTPTPLQDVAKPAQAAEQKLADLNITPVTTARYGKLRRGRIEELAIHLERSQTTCPGCTPGQNRQPYVQMQSLEIEPAKGFSVQFSYDGKHFRSRNKGNIVFTKGGAVILAKLKAQKDLGLGEYVLRGKLWFQVIGKGRNSGPEQVEILIPVTVVDHDAPIVKSSWRYAPVPGHPLRTTVATILLGPLLLPAVLVIILYCVAIDCDLH